MTESLFSDPEPAEPLHPHADARPSLDPFQDPFQVPAAFPKQPAATVPPTAPAGPAR